MTTSSSFLTNDKRQCGSDEHPQLENDKRKKKTKKLLSLKQNSAPITSLPDPVKSQFTDKLKKSSGSLFDKGERYKIALEIPFNCIRTTQKKSVSIQSSTLSFPSSF